MIFERILAYNHSKYFLYYSLFKWKVNMNKDSMLEIVKNLPFDQRKSIYKDGSAEVQIFRPSALRKRFKSYDVKKNFQVWLKDEVREFRAKHLRVMLDLNLRVRSRPDLKEALLTAFDNIFYGSDPEKELNSLAKEKYEHYLNSLIIIGSCHQLFIIEQEYGSPKKSNYEPPTLYYQGWVREFTDNPMEIDELCSRICSFHPPLPKYVNLENKKDKKFKEDLKPLWYL